jgi:hypothetical protein
VPPLDAGDQTGPTVVALLCPGAVQQAGLDYAFVVQPPHRATQPFDGPGRCLPAVQDLHDVATRLIRVSIFLRDFS